MIPVFYLRKIKGKKQKSIVTIAPMMTHQETSSFLIGLSKQQCFCFWSEQADYFQIRMGEADYKIYSMCFLT